MAGEFNLLDLPEGCIADVLVLTTPKDAARLALVASSLRSAAQSDTVWERFLPSNYLHIIARSNKSLDFFSSFASKKELYLYLCDNPILIDGDTKSFSLDKGSGKKCYMLAARDLHISWGETPRYWHWIALPKSRFPEVAELLFVWWLEIIGKIKTDMLSPGTTYGAYLVFTTISGLAGFEYPFAEGIVGISSIGGKASAVCFDPDGARKLGLSFMERRDSRSEFVQLRQQHLKRLNKGVVNCPNERGDGWLEVELGQFFVKERDEGELEMSLREVRDGGVKRGLVVQGIEIRPKHVKSHTVV